MKPSDVRQLLGFKLPSTNSERRILDRCHDISDLRRVAARRTPRPVFDYVAGGADDEITLKANEEAFRRWEFTPDSLIDVSGCDTSTNLLGHSLAFPLVLAPTGYTRMMHPEGEMAVGRAARRTRLPYALSSVASTSIEELATVDHDALWFQLYVWKDRELTYDLMSRAHENGYRVLEVSVDVYAPGNRIRDIRNGLTIPPSIGFRSMVEIGIHPRYWVKMLRSPMLEFANAPPSMDGRGITIENMTAQFDPSVSWSDLDEIRARWPGELLVKGPLNPEDAKRAVESGADGVHISNHGGRQLDRLVPPIESCPRIREAIGDDATLVIDSGIRHGADIAIAIARGADAGAVGRPYLYGLMAAGESGVLHAIELLASQFHRTMQLLGAPTVADLRRRGSQLLRQGDV